MNKLFVVIIILLLGLNAAFVWKSCKKETTGALCSVPTSQPMDAVHAVPFFLPGAVSLFK